MFIGHAEALQLAAEAKSQATAALAERDNKIEQLQPDSMQQQEPEVWNCRGVMYCGESIRYDCMHNCCTL